MSKKYRVLFIQATQYSATGSKKLCKKNRMYLPGLVFPLLAAYTPDHWDVKVKLEVVDDVDFNEDADMVGIGCMGHAVFRGIDIADEFRKRGKTVFFGGYMPSMLPSFVAPHADSIVIGDAEISYPKLLKDFEKNGRLKPVYNNPLDSLAGLPVPKYEYIIEKNIGDMLPVQAGRGCPHSCSFCSVACIYKGKYMVRPIEEVMRDIDRVQELGYRGIYLLDDNIVGNPRYLEDFADRMMDRKMIWSSQCSLQLARNPRLLKKVADSGCKVLSFGLESITQEGLDKLNKRWVKVDEHEELLARIREAGIMASTEMMIGTDSDTEESIRETAAFVRRAKVAIPRFYVLTPFPGSPLYDEYMKRGKLMHENYIEYTGTNCVHYPDKISPEKLNEMYRWITREVFSLGHIFSRLVFNRYFMRNFKYYFIALLMNLQYRFMTRRGDAPNIF